MIYDAVLCVSPLNREVALKAIRSLRLFAQSRTIFVITAQKNFSFFLNNLGAEFPVRLLDEDNLIEDIGLREIQAYFTNRTGSPQRAGWYFQQFLKMAISQQAEIADHYLIWDSDTIMLQPVNFFDDKGSVLVNAKSENHKPYFQTITQILSIEKQVKFSFISEHLMVNKRYMSQLIDALQTRAAATSWVEYVLNSVADKDINASGFSEYETYGNFVCLNYPGHLQQRSLKSTRFGTLFYGPNPTQQDLFCLKLANYVFATFEAKQMTSKYITALPKALSSMIYTGGQWFANRSDRQQAIAEICQSQV
jgi:hypothetical protein